MGMRKYILLAISILIVFVVTGDPNITSAQILFEDRFESGDFTKWSRVKNETDVSINSDPRFIHSGNYSVRIHYVIPPSAPEHHDSNRYLLKYFNGLDHFFVSGYVYHGTPLNNERIQRKLYYFKDPSHPTEPDWSLVLTSFNYNLAMDPSPPRNDPIYQDGDKDASWGLFKFMPNRWYKVEIELKDNTPGKRDGYVRVWVDGTQVLDRNNMNLRGTLTTGITRIEIGRQADRTKHIPVDEYRYWDDILITHTPDTTPPASPSGLTIQ